MASGDTPDTPNLPRGLIGRRGTPTGKSARLPSLRGPRDLTLGGVPKKTFAPSIPMRKDRNKTESVEAVSSSVNKTDNSRRQDGRGRGRGRGERGRGRGRGRGRDENVLQSHSIFEQGPSEKLINKSSSYSDYGERGSGRVATSKTIKKEKSDPADTKRVLDNLLCDDFIDDSRDDADALTPVCLPLSYVSIKEEIKKDKILPIKAELKGSSIEIDIEEESADIDMVDSSTPSTSKEPDEKAKTESIITIVKKERRPSISCQQIFCQDGKSEKGELLFFQFPDVLPGVPPSRGDEERPPQGRRQENQTLPPTSATQNTNKPEDQNSTKPQTCKLKDFSEGHIGKLQIRKSGRAQLVLGHIVLDVTSGTTCAFLQEAVSVKPGEEGGGDMTVLGSVNHKLICTPDFEQLLKFS